MRRGHIPAFPVFVDGMVRAVNAVYGSFPESLSPPLRRRIKKGESPFYSEAIRAVGAPGEREAVLSGPPCCIVASSGMLTGGASAFYAARLAAGAENLIAITGYQDEESPGRALLDLAAAGGDKERVLVLNNQRVPASCRVETYSLSAHADAGELAALVQRLRPNSVYLVHGDQEARRALATSLDLHLPEGVHLPENGGVYQVEREGRRGPSRQYGGGVSRRGLGAGRDIDTGALEEIRTYALETGGQGLMRVQDLAEIWCGSETASLADMEKFKAVLDGEQDSYIADKRRPYLFRVAVEDNGPTVGAGPMEMNQARARIQEVFPPQTGLFRFGVHQEEGVYELAFHFPDRILADYGDRLEALEEETGWKIRVRQTPHQERLFEEALAAVPEGVKVTKAPALHLEKKEVSVGVEVPGDMAEKWLQLDAVARGGFVAATGYGLVLVSSQDQALASVPQREDAWEINRAYARIREVFAGQPHAPYKIGRKVDSAGAHIEVAFISPAVGGRYQDLLQQLESEIGWPLRIRAAVHQQMIADAAHRLTPPDCVLRGTARLFAAQDCVVVPVGQVPPAEKIAALEEAFREATGLQISWEVGG